MALWLNQDEKAKAYHTLTSWKKTITEKQWNLLKDEKVETTGDYRDAAFYENREVIGAIDVHKGLMNFRVEAAPTGMEVLHSLGYTSTFGGETCQIERIRQRPCSSRRECRVATLEIYRVKGEVGVTAWLGFFRPLNLEDLDALLEGSQRRLVPKRVGFIRALARRLMNH